MTRDFWKIVAGRFKPPKSFGYWISLQGLAIIPAIVYPVLAISKKLELTQIAFGSLSIAAFYSLLTCVASASLKIRANDGDHPDSIVPLIFAGTLGLLSGVTFTVLGISPSEISMAQHGPLLIVSGLAFFWSLGFGIYSHWKYYGKIYDQEMGEIPFEDRNQVRKLDLDEPRQVQIGTATISLEEEE